MSYCERCAALERELATARERIADLDRREEIAIWNLAGCDVIAGGGGPDQHFDEAMARPALYAVQRMARRCLRTERRCAELEKGAEAFRALAGVARKDAIRIELATIENGEVLMLQHQLDKTLTDMAPRVFKQLWAEFDAAIAAAIASQAPATQGIAAEYAGGQAMQRDKVDAAIRAAVQAVYLGPDDDPRHDTATIHRAIWNACAEACAKACAKAGGASPAWDERYATLCRAQKSDAP